MFVCVYMFVCAYVCAERVETGEKKVAVYIVVFRGYFRFYAADSPALSGDQMQYRDQWRVGYMQGKCFNSCTISPANFFLTYTPNESYITPIPNKEER